MKKIPEILFCLMAVLSGNAWSGEKTLVELDDSSLQSVVGQSGVDLSLKMSLNHKLDYSFDTSVCTANALEYCRLALSFNNRYDDGSNDTYNNGVRVPSTTGKKLWMVFKGIQGTIIIDKLALDGTDVVFINGNNTLETRAGLNLSFDPNKSIKFRNFGFQSLSLETDTATNEAGVAGYLDTTKYTKTDTSSANQPSTGNAFDGYNPDMGGTAATGVGREKGFLGLSVNGNLAVTGNIKIFSCLNHVRCS